LWEQQERRGSRAADSADPDRWQSAFRAVIDRVAPRFARYEPCGTPPG
jgi:hypothetical protein